MYLLDTDHMSLIEHGGLEYERIRTHLRAVPPDDVATTIVSYEEQTRGWLARIAQMTTPEQQVSVYEELRRQLRNYCDIAIVQFDYNAAVIVASLRKSGVR